MFSFPQVFSAKPYLQLFYFRIRSTFSANLIRVSFVNNYKNLNTWLLGVLPWHNARREFDGIRSTVVKVEMKGQTDSMLIF